ncbi:DUF1643 domain-containing protein [Thiobacillus denitrificans]|uniref:DUF1643 domain-containing protein n=1 Tax=Thiobacillus denitrificans TaxID=36861 RepID=UPI0003785F20|nr:DUF1643 domain-containing protein [Thiobacillus denitrificans]
MDGAVVIQVQFGAALEQQRELGSDSGQKSQLFPESAGADFAGGRVWRYSLWRVWDERLPYANFLMLNPSIADENQLDPTVTRCVDFARRWGYGGLYVTNLFALVSTDPNALYTAVDPVGKDNDRVIVQTARQAGLVVCAWGNHGTHTDRRDTVLKLLREAEVPLHYLKMNGTGEPAHPLYLPAALVPTLWA